MQSLFEGDTKEVKEFVADYAGRLHRNYEGKQEVWIYDYVDVYLPMLFCSGSTRPDRDAGRRSGETWTFRASYALRFKGFWTALRGG